MEFFNLFHWYVSLTMCMYVRKFVYTWFTENGFFSVHSFNEHYLSILQYTGRGDRGS